MKWSSFVDSGGLLTVFPSEALEFDLLRTDGFPKNGVAGAPAGLEKLESTPGASDFLTTSAPRLRRAMTLRKYKPTPRQKKMPRVTKPKPKKVPKNLSLMRVSEPGEEPVKWETNRQTLLVVDFILKLGLKAGGGLDFGSLSSSFRVVMRDYLNRNLSREEAYNIVASAVADFAEVTHEADLCFDEACLHHSGVDQKKLVLESVQNRLKKEREHYAS